MKSLGWKEQPSVINKSNMVVMEFSKGGKKLSFTAMQMGPKVNVSADGSGLVMAARQSPSRQAARRPGRSAAKAAVQDLEAEPDSALPVPKQHSHECDRDRENSRQRDPFRRELEASIPAELNAVLAFYRSELGKRGWKETAERAVMKPDQVQLAFASADGPAMLKLGRSNGETSVNLAPKISRRGRQGRRHPAAGSGQAGVRQYGRQRGHPRASTSRRSRSPPAPAGRNRRSPDAGSAAGQISVFGEGRRPAGRAASTIEVAADDAWGLMVAPSGEVLSLQMY